MTLTKLSPLLASLVLAGCAGSGAAPAASPPPAQTTDVGATEAQGGANVHESLDEQLAKIDAALADIAKRLQVAQDSAKVELEHQLAILQKRDDELKTQLRAAGAQEQSNSDKVHDDMQRAIKLLDGDMKKLERKLQP